LSPINGAEGRAIVRENASIVDSLLREPANGTGKKGNGRGLLLIGQDLNVSQSSGIVDGDMDLFVTSATEAALPSITGDPVADPLKPSQLFCDINHVTKPLPLVTDNWLSRLQIFESVQTQPVHHTTNSRQGRMKRLGDASERAALVA
jgi:hypothetical protein